MKRYSLILAVAAVVAFLDQFTKALVLESLPEYSGIRIIDGFFNLVHVHNRGAAFGFLNRSDIEWQFLLFSGVGLLALVIIFFMARQAPARSHGLFIALGCILGGAAGNFIDRFRFRYVIDFLDFYIGEYHWPAFNVADIAIVLGVGALLLNSLFSSRKSKEGMEKKGAEES